MSSSTSSIGFVPPYFFKHMSSIDELNAASWEKCYKQSVKLLKKRAIESESFASSRMSSRISAPIDINSYIPKVNVITDNPGDNEAKDAKKNGLATLIFLQKVFGRASFDNQGSTLTIHLHAKGYENNAYWEKNSVYIGDVNVSGRTTLTKDPDVLAHEVGHGVVRYTAGFEYTKESGALDESWADVLGSMVKQSMLKQKASQADWLIGDEYVKDLPETVLALRSMKNPGSAYPTDPQIDHVEKMRSVNLDMVKQDNEGVHIFSGIPNKAFYSFSMSFPTQHSWETAGRIWYNALGFCNSKTTFGEFANATVKALELMQFSLDVKKILVSSWSAVGVRAEFINDFIAQTSSPYHQPIRPHVMIEIEDMDRKSHRPARRSVQPTYDDPDCCTIV